MRPPKASVDPWRPVDVLVEEERLPEGGRARTLTVFLAGSECPFTCVFCDLWRFTLDQPTPPGAIPAQLRAALRQVSGVAGELSASEPLPGDPAAGKPVLKLYNASNFFDPRAVPVADDPEIARLAAPFLRLVVESHPRLAGRRCLELADRLEGRLQVAMGLETVHPEALPRLGKELTLDGFRRAAERLRSHSIEIRAFVLIGVPFVSSAEAVLWAERSAAFAFEHGAAHVTLIPTRGGNGEMERLELAGEFVRPRLAQVEEALERCLELGGVVTVDTWDLERFADCSACRAQRIARLERINLSGAREPRICCGQCDAP